MSLESDSRRWKAHCTRLGSLLALMTGLYMSSVCASGDEANADADLPSAPVVIDGTTLFRVRGTSLFPPERRADAIVARIEAFADDETLPVDSIHLVGIETGTAVFAGDERLTTIQDADARLEALDRTVLATMVADSIGRAVVRYRAARTSDALLRSAGGAAVATVVLATLLAFVVWIARKLHSVLDDRLRQRVQSLHIQSFQIVRAERIVAVLRQLLRVVWVVAIVAMLYAYLHRVLAFFPWTRGVSGHLAAYVMGPLRSMASAAAAAAPDLIVLVVIFFITRYALKLIQLFFAAVGRGEVKLSGFEKDWATPTYRLVRIATVAFALVVAYPYVPGSGSDAFKGISIFLGILLSLGSSSAIANLIAGYMITYRRAFHIGDRVKIGDAVGDVIETRLQVTHLRTVKNEEVVIPNSTILTDEVVNFSSLARTRCAR